MFDKKDVLQKVHNYQPFPLARKVFFLTDNIMQFTVINTFSNSPMLNRILIRLSLWLPAIQSLFHFRFRTCVLRSLGAAAVKS
jgi:hypothetical protein